MKKIIIISILSLFALVKVSAQTMIVFTNGPTFITITNITLTTIVEGKEGDDTVKMINNNVIDPNQGRYLGAIVTQTTAFIITPFPTNYFHCTFYYRNPNNFKIDFNAYTPIKWMNGSAPTTNTDGCILFENVLGQLRATQ